MVETKGPKIGQLRMSVTRWLSKLEQRTQYMAKKVLTRSFQCAIDHWHPTDSRGDIRVLRLVANGLVKETSRLQMVVAQSIPVRIN